MTPPTTPPDPHATPPPALPPPASAAPASPPPPQPTETSPPPALPPFEPITPPIAAPAPAVDPTAPVTPASDVDTPVLASEPPVLPPPAPPPPPPAHPLVFHGRTEEYFRIWIVNTLLTIVTCGIFFSWAKVRKRRYIRGSTELLGHRFDYQADPLRLLIGHLVVLTLMLGYSLFGSVYPWVRYSVIALAGVLLPWIVVRSLTFNAHNTVYRGLRFRFHRSLTAAFMVYLLPALLVVPIAYAMWAGNPGLAGILIIIGAGFFPAWQRAKRRYAIENHRYGDAYFRYTGKTGAFYGAYFAAGGIVFSSALLAVMAIGILFSRRAGVAPTMIQLIPFFAVYIFGFWIAKQLLFAMLFNHVWNHTQLDEHRFRARLPVGRWLGMQLANLGAIIITAGMLYPWTEIRNQRLVAASLEFLPAGPVDGIRAFGGRDGSATGDMAAEFIGIDFGL